jgi:SAM-dependent methyltransferase
MTQYEKSQNYNKVLSYIHNIRFNEVIRQLKSFKNTHEGGVIKILDIGCAYGKLYSVLNNEFNINYIGIEPNQEFFEVAQKNFADNSNFTIFNSYAQDILDDIKNIDIVISLETLEHIPESICVRIIEKIKNINPKFFIVSVPIEIGLSVWMKNIFSFITGYSRHKDYTWKETFYAGLGKLDKLPPHEIEHKGFDYRWLAQTIRHNFKIIKTKKFPVNFLPASFGVSIFFVAKPRNNDLS